MNSEVSGHLQALRTWIEEQSQIPRLVSRLSVEEQKQLLAVNKAVEQLTRSGVPVPEDLRNLKLKLSVKDASCSKNQKNEIQFKEMESLIEELSGILKTARSIRNRLKVTVHAGGPKIHYGITLLDLLQNGLISTEDRFELQWHKKGPIFTGRVKIDGTIMIEGKAGWENYASLSTAAEKVAGRPMNGWKHWRRVNSDGTSTALEDIRDRYMNKEAD